MAMRDRSNLLKNLLVVGAAGAGLLISLPALAQSTEEPAAAPEEFKLSAEGFKILCEHFPLNSRCEGGQAVEQPTSLPSSPEPRESVNPGTSSEPSFPPAPSMAPEPSAPSDAPSLEPSAPSVEPSTTEPSGGMDAPSGGMEAPQPSLPSAPESPKPQSLTVPGAEAPKGERGGSTTEAPNAAPASPATPTTPGAAPRSPVTPAPGAAPAPGSGSAPSAAPASGAPAVTEVSDAELQKFAKVIPALQEIQQTAQQQVSEAIKKAGLTEDRFRELYTAQQSPSGTPAAAAAPASAATPQEQQAVQQVTTQLESIKTQTQTRREQAVRSQGLELNRFNEILAAVRQDSGLQQQLQQMLNN
jgi:Domain of unknown function (DUF4168)